MTDDNLNETDSDGLALARWSSAVGAIRDALSNLDFEEYVNLSRNLEIELGLRAVVDAQSARPIDDEEWISILMNYEENHSRVLHTVVPRLERALASSPERWVNYVNKIGRSCFDPVELASCAAIAKSFADDTLAEVHVKINQLILWSWDCLLGQRPIPQVRQFPQQDHPTLHLVIIRAIEKVELNWRSIGLRPIITNSMTVRWASESESWTAWIQLAHIQTGIINPNAVLRLNSDGFWRILRPS